MKVSIIIPAYNEAQGIKETLMELEEYISEDFEILVVDDGSTDNTFEIVNHLAAGNIRCIQHKVNRGTVRQLRQGAKMPWGILSYGMTPMVSTGRRIWSTSYRK